MVTSLVAALAPPRTSKIIKNGLRFLREDEVYFLIRLDRPSEIALES